MVRPSKDDAELLLKLVEISHSPVMEAAFTWLRCDMAVKHEKLKKFEDYEKEYPPGSDGAKHAMAVESFWETAGVLVKHGLIHEDLFFDRFFVETYWDLLGRWVLGQRETSSEPRLAENFEWLSRKEAEWRKEKRSSKKR